MLDLFIFVCTTYVAGAVYNRRLPRLDVERFTGVPRRDIKDLFEMRPDLAPVVKELKSCAGLSQHIDFFYLPAGSFHSSCMVSTKSLRGLFNTTAIAMTEEDLTRSSDSVEAILAHALGHVIDDKENPDLQNHPDSQQHFIERINPELQGFKLKINHSSTHGKQHDIFHDIEPVNTETKPGAIAAFFERTWVSNEMRKHNLKQSEFTQQKEFRADVAGARLLQDPAKMISLRMETARHIGPMRQFWHWRTNLLLGTTHPTEGQRISHLRNIFFTQAKEPGNSDTQTTVEAVVGFLSEPYL